MAETRVVVTADAAQAVREFNRLRTEATGSINQVATAGNQLGHVGVSAAQTAAALRQVPAQLTDIVVGLQSGQAPLTVLLQQGGQLKDMFGGVVPAARALTGYVAGLVSPTTVLAAAVGGLAIAYVQGSKEAQAYNAALIVSGNAAGTSRQQLAGMAHDISKVVGTQGQAAEALAALTATGKVGAENLKQFATVAVQAQKALGASAADTANQFAELAKSPLQATEKLNEKFHYLTGSVYEQIKALQDRGRADAAAEVAQKAYADALADRSARMTANLGLIERAWNGITGAAKWAWDAMLDTGREATLEERLKKVQAKINKGPQKSMLGGPVGFDTEEGNARSTKKLKDEASALQDQIEKRDRIAAIEAGKAKFNEADLEWTKQVNSNLTRRQQLANELAANEARGLEAGRSDKEISDEALKIRQKYSDIYNDTVNAQIEGIKRTGEIQDVVAARSLAALNATRNAGLDSSLAAQEAYARDVEQLDQAQIARHREQLVEELALTKKKLNSEKDQETLRQEIAKLDEESISRRLALENELYVLDVNSTRASAIAAADRYDKRSKDLETLEHQVQAQRDANTVIGQSRVTVAAFNKALVEEAARRKEVEADILDTILGREKEAEVLRSTAKAMRELAAAQEQGAEKTVGFELAKQQWESLDQTAHAVFVDIFNGGKSTFDRLRDTLKSGLLDLLYQMTVKRWIFQIGANVTGFSGLNPAAQSGPGGIFGAASGAASLYNAGTSLISGASITSSLGSGISSIGSALGSSAISEFGAGFSGAASAESIAATLAGDVAPSLTAAASAGASLASALSTAVPYVAAAAVAYKLFDSFFGSGKESDTRLTFASNNAPGAISINERGNEGKSDAYIAGASTKSSFGTFGVSSTFWAPAESQTVQDFVKTVGLADDALAKYLTVQEKANVSAYLTGKTTTAHVGAEGDITSANSAAALSKVLVDRILNVLDGVEPGLAKLEEGFQGTSSELASEAASLLAYRAALKDSGEAVFGMKVTLEQIAALKQPTEATSAALTRVAAEFEATTQLAQLAGVDGATAFGQLGLGSEAARAQLILLSGGLSNFNAQIADYAQNYLSDAERLAPIAKQLDQTLAGLGLETIPKTIGQFKSLVDQLISSGALATDAGAKQLAALLSIEKQFAQVHAETATAASSVSDAKSALTEAYSRERDAINATITSTRSYVTSLQGLRGSLLLGDLSPLTPQERYAQAKSQYEATKLAAASGDTAAQQRLSDALTAFLTASRTVNASSEQYRADFAETQSDLAKAVQMGKGQLDTAQASLDALDKQVAGLVTVNTSVLTVAQAVRDLAAAMGADGKSVVSTSQSGALDSLYTSLLGRHPDAGGLQFWSQVLSNGANIGQVAAGIAQSPEYISIHGSHRDGLERVPFDGYIAMLHRDEGVLTASENRAYRSGGAAGNADFIAEFRSLRGEITRLRADQAEQTAALIASNLRANADAASKVANATVGAARESAWALKTAARLT